MYSKKDSGIIATIKGGKPENHLSAQIWMRFLSKRKQDFFASKHEGCSACLRSWYPYSHALGAGKVPGLTKMRFQEPYAWCSRPSEEQSRGAEVMIENGGVEGADAVFGTHIGTILDKTIPSGTVIVTQVAAWVAFDKFVIKVNGKGCHGSTLRRELIR